MSRYESLMQRIDNGERILIDGATGTEVQLRGVPMLEHAWNGGGALTHPEIVKAVHEDYIRHGAEVIISNTFGNSFHALEDSGMEDKFDFLNRRSVELAVEARESLDKPYVLVAGGITHWSWTGRHPTLEQLSANVTQQAQIMKETGADLIMLEMMAFVDRTQVLIEASLASGLPVWVGISCKKDEAGNIVLREGEPLTEMIEMIKEYDVPLVNIMHTEVKFVDGCLDILMDNWKGAVGVYAHSGKWDGDKIIYNSTISAAEYTKESKRWLDRGVQLIGGCCGIGPDHIQSLSEIMDHLD